MLSLKRYKSFLKNKYLLFFLALSILGYYLWPLFHSPLFIESFDNLDSNVVWYKILSESGKAFAPSSEIVPNMMNGLPRLSFGSEWDVLYWFYHIFPAETAWRINAFLIHIVAFFSMYLFLERYVRVDHEYHKLLSVIVSLLYAMLPFWPNAGLSTSLLPLYTYILFNILNRRERWFEWLLLVLLPLYSNFVFLYMFYIVFGGAAWVVISLKRHRLEKRLFIALVVMTVSFLLTQYRLVEAQLYGSGFLSHRSEFNIYFNHNFHDAYVYALKFFLDGWMEHQRTLMMPVLLPVVLVAILLSLLNRKFNTMESFLVFVMIALSFYTDIWKVLIINKYFLPAFFLLLLLLIWRKKEYRIFYGLMLAIILLSIWNGLCFYDGMAFLKEHFIIFKMLNLSRAAFIAPFLYYVVLYFSFSIILQKLEYATLLIAIIITYQTYYSVKVRRFDNSHKYKTVTMESYYAPDMFEKIKHDINNTSRHPRVVNYGIEPAVSLYNGLYTVDGYSTNYPLSYKKKFEAVQERCFERAPGNKKIYDEWGSKAYLLCIDSRPENYHYYKERNITAYAFNANAKKLCDLGTEYVLSSHKLLDDNATKGFVFMKRYISLKSMWKLYLYRLPCKQR